uniref:Interleukin 23 receptor n=1 Tax=Strix occidentalis caurina TaxID=311401 RepID=A0A8D0G2R8_STROC
MLLPVSQQSGAAQPVGITASRGTPAWRHPDPTGVGTGVANIKCSGHVWIEPAPVVQMGSNISINCLSTLGCPWAKFSIFLNYTPVEGPLHPLNSSTVQLRLRDFQMPVGAIACFIICPNSEGRQLVCGTDIHAGYPPDPPNNLTCSIHEYSGRLVCTWDAGRPTHLHTHYTLHLLNLTQLLKSSALNPVTRSALRGGTRYSAWVQASNALGTARSAPRPLDLQELVVPALPLVTGAETMETSSSPTTVIRWRRQTLLENVRCEERHKATGTLEWHVAAWDDVAQHGPRSQHDLQSNTQYVFQVRCRLSPADSPWSAWSPPFLYTTPEAGKLRPITSLRCSGGTWPKLQAAEVSYTVTSWQLVSRPPSSPGPAVGCRIKATVVSLLPKWLFEDFPHLENSSVVKSLQEKSDFASNTFHEPFLDTSDPTVMEVEEVPVHKDYKTVATQSKPSREVLEAREHPGSTAPASIVTPEQISDYKPQVSDGNPLGYVATNIYQTQLPTPLPEPEVNIFFRDYTSPVPQLWDGEGEGHHVCLLEKINLILNNSRSGQSHMFALAQGGPGSLPENQWGHVLASDVQEQTLVPDELVSCLRAMNGESVDIKTCFPQSIGRLF